MQSLVPFLETVDWFDGTPEDQQLISEKPPWKQKACLDFPDFGHRDFLPHYLAHQRLSIEHSSGNPVFQRYATPIFIHGKSPKLGMERRLQAKPVLGCH